MFSKGIVKAQLLRYIRLSSHFHDCMQSYRILKSNLLNYGYTRLFIRICKQSALSLTNCQRNSMITGCQPCRSINAVCVSIHVLPLSLPVIYTITLFLLPKTHVATRATAFTPFIALCAHTFLLSTWAKLRIAFDPDSHNTNTTSPHTTKIQSCLNISIKPITTYLCSEFLYFNSLQRTPKIHVKLISCAKNVNYCG